MREKRAPSSDSILSEFWSRFTVQEVEKLASENIVLTCLCKNRSCLLQPMQTMKVWLWKFWCRLALEAELTWHMRLWRRSPLLENYPGPFNPRLCWWSPAVRSWYCTIAFMFRFLCSHFSVACQKAQLPCWEKWLDGFVLKQAPKLLFMGWLSMKCWDKLVDTRVSVLEINCITDTVAEWELCTLICPINCCLYIFWLSILPSYKICCNYHQLFLFLLECTV